MNFDFDEIKTQFNEYVDNAKKYFASLNTFEEVGWIFIVLGFTVFVTGFILL